MNPAAVTGDTRVGKVILSARVGTCMHTHRCSLFSQAAIILHARGYESLEKETPRERAF